MIKLRPMNDDETKLIRVLRACFWSGAILDAGAAVQMLHPGVFRLAYGLPADWSPGREWRFAMGMGASLMIGWTVLLVWGAARPLERAGVLAVTVLPVVLGLALNEVAAIADGFLPAAWLAPVFVIQLVLGVAFLGAWRRARVGRPSLPRSA
jgi:hypothetical protein